MSGKDKICMLWTAAKGTAAIPDKSLSFKEGDGIKMTGMTKLMCYVNNKEVIVLFESDNVGITWT